MVDDGILHLYTAGGEITLEIVGVILCIPQTPLCKGEQGEGLLGVALVGENDLLNLAVVILRHKEGDLGLQTVLLAGDDGVAHTVTALVSIQLGLDGRPAGIPDGSVVIDIEITAAHIDGNIVITISGNSAETGILIEGVTSGSVGDQGKETLCAQIVDPRVRGPGRCDDVFAACVIEETKFHSDSPFELND